MALSTLSIPIANFRQYDSGGANDIPNIGNVEQTGNLSKWTAKFDPDTEQFLHIFFPVSNYSSGTSLIIRLRWRANVTTGDCRWKTKSHNYDQSGTSWGGGDPSSGNPQTVTTTTSGTTNQINETVFTLTNTLTGTGPNVAVILLSRDAANGGDTLAVDAELLEVLAEWAIDTTVHKLYTWVPANAMALPSGSTAVDDATNDSGNSTYRPYKWKMVANDTLDFKFSLPSTFSSALKWQMWVVQASSFQTFTAHISMGNAAVGANSDPALSVASAVTTSAGSSYLPHLRASIMQAVPITPSASDELFCRFTRETGGSGNMYLLGVLFEYIATQKTPGRTTLDPKSAALPSSGAATLTQTNDSNSSKLVAQFPSGSITTADFIGFNPSSYNAGGTLRVRWRANTSSTNSAVFRIDFASPATNVASDPSLTQSSNVVSANGGTNFINEFTVDISSGLAASDLEYVRLNRLGTNGSDTLASTAEVLDVSIEHTVT